MSTELKVLLNNVNAYRESRLEMAQFILDNKNHFEELVSICFSPSHNNNNNNNNKACWILEMVIDAQPHLLTDHLDFFCLNLNKFTHNSAIRSAAKTCLHLSKHLTLSNLHQNLITENCFDWLMNDDGKVATKAYSIRTLFELGKEISWIHPELKQIIIKDYPTHSSAYKAVAREILKKIK